MARQSFATGQLQDRGGKLRETGPRAGDHAGTPQEVVGRQAARKPSRAAGRQHVGWAGGIIADRHGRISTEENRPGMINLVAGSFRIRGGNVYVLGSELVYAGNRLLLVPRQDKGAKLHEAIA